MNYFRNSLGLCVTGLVLVCVSAAPALASAVCTPPPAGMISWYTADNTAADLLGVNNGGGAVTYGGAKVGTASFSFNGGGADFVQVPDSPSLEPAHITVDAWVQNNGTPGSFRYLLGKGGSGCNHASYALYTGSGGGLIFYIWDGAAVRTSPAALAANVWDGGWHHVAGTFDGSFVRLYVDGVEVGAGTAAAGSIGYGLPTSDDLFIGKFGGTCTLPMTGLVDEVEIFNRALSQPEIAAIWAADYAGKCKDGACCIGGGTPNTPAECIEVERDECAAQGGLFLGEVTTCDYVDCYPLLVTYEYINVESTPAGVKISWGTETEIDTVGFRILRETEGKKLVVLSDLIPSAGHGLTGASYEFLDNSGLRPGVYRYYLEDIDINGKATRQGPFTVHVEGKPNVGTVLRKPGK